MTTVEQLGEYIDAGAAKTPADLVIEHGTLVNVDTGEYYPADVAVWHERIVAVDPDVSAYVGPDTTHIDATGKYLAPGLIDGHIHVECSKLSMTRFAQAVVPHGTTSIVSGLDEYISAIGLDGLEEIFKEIDGIPLKVFWGLPYKTPYTIPESTISYNVGAADHERWQPKHRCFGVWETVRESVALKDPDTLKAISVAQGLHKPVFGCSPMARGIGLNQFLMSGVHVDHESYSHEEFLEKARKGVHVVIRESSVTKFLAENIRAITEGAPGMARHTSFCTDDVNARDVLEHGHLDHMVRLAINAGVSPMTAIQMGSINGAEAYHIDDRVGSIAPGKDADILLVDQPGTFNVETVISKGEIVTLEGKTVADFVPPQRSASLQGALHHAPLAAGDFEYRVDTAGSGEGEATVATIHSVGPFVRKRKDVVLDVRGGSVRPSVDKDTALVSVIERYGVNGNHARGFISGWGIKHGAIATSVAPDDNNLVVAGMSTDDMALAANTLIECGGGQVVVADGEVKALLKLPIGSITTDDTPEELAAKEIELKKAAEALGSQLPDPLFYLSFLPITSIPDLAITDGGNVDYTKLRYFDPIVKIDEKA
ncbi:adenine deaminase C-terminal domain-containing protein [Bifidobacterium sp. ESL0790]|uniref:adenine deaminase C-terminal domain-containing protein n=1 Tax=Bifidobacterium sp. ESL0790 TaxID=2983233 RepID=UPI0023F8CE32|nr:adenine deaminase C-terminal domain-containing protein [Bifidobacterium sp. ESL0790]WEV71898.1 amidohydrolase family protein [Bifidobacterium sp. ESL0790]